MLQSLEQDGLIYKQDHPTDKRNKLIFLTEAGRQMQYVIEEAGAATEAALLKGIDPDDIATTKRVLTILYHNLSAKKS